MSQKEKIDHLKQKARELRQTALTMIHTAQSGHPGGSLSAADIMAALYFGELRLDPQNPKWEDRDRFVLSKGHTCPILYSALILRGFMPGEEVRSLRKYGSLLQGHPDMKRTPGIDISTGSLGQGVSCAVGMAIGLKRAGKQSRVFCMAGDGETNEGQVWEAVECAVKYGLDNLILIIDNNRIQNDGFCEEIMPLQSLSKKLEAFGCAVQSINGHVMEEIMEALEKIRGAHDGRPHAIVAATVKGRGVSFMEDVPKWHGVAPNDEEFRQSLIEIQGGLK